MSGQGSRHIGRPQSTRQSGYILVLVLGALVLLALVAARIASRVDLQRSMSTPFLDEASADAMASSALSVALYWIATQPLNANGVGSAPTGNWLADGRWYALSDEVSVSLQDERGLVSINQPDSPVLRRLIEQQGIDPRKADQLIDVLADYVDTDNLKRLNGAEQREYQILGLNPPRNDLLLSVNELKQMPYWRDEPDLISALEPNLSLRVTGAMNPNTAPRAVLRALFPGASPQQLELFDTLRQTAAFAAGEQAALTTGLPMKGDDYVFHVSNEFRLTIWVRGQPRAREYNLRLDPGGLRMPWQITRFQTVDRPNISSTSRLPFESPLPAIHLPADRRSR